MADIRKVGLLVVQQGKVLLCRSQNRPDTLILPGGKREAGETSLETLERELREELGEVTLAAPVVLGTYVAATASGNKTVEIELFSGQLRGEPTPCSEIAELVWFGPEDCWEWLAPSLSGLIFPDLRHRGILPWKGPESANKQLPA